MKEGKNFQHILWPKEMVIKLKKAILQYGMKNRQWEIIKKEIGYKGSVHSVYNKAVLLSKEANTNEEINVNKSSNLNDEN